jgi:hypothetical protein
MTDQPDNDHFPDVGNMIEDDHSTEVSNMIDEFRYGVGEGSYIDRVPLPEKARNEESNDCLRIYSYRKKFKMIFTNNQKKSN